MGTATGYSRFAIRAPASNFPTQIRISCRECSRILPASIDCCSCVGDSVQVVPMFFTAVCSVRCSGRN